MRIFWERSRTSSVLGGLIALTLLTGALGVHLSPAGSAEVVEASNGTVAVDAGSNYFCDPALGDDVDPAIYCETTIHVGDSIQWDNIAGFHDATECGAGWSNWDGSACVGADWASGFMPPGASFTQPFNAAGSYDYLCQIHGLSMKGTITVLPTMTPTPTSAPTATQAPTPAATQAPTPTATQTPTPAATQAPTQAATQAPTQAATQAPTPTATPSFTPALTSSPSATASPEPTGDPTPTALPASTAQVTATPTPTAAPETSEAATPSANSGDVAGLPSSGGIPGIGSGVGAGGLLLIADIGLALVTAAAFGWFVGRRASG